MTSLLLKDFYILFNNAKAFIFMILIFAFAFIPSSGFLAYIVASGIMSSMMVVTTFSYDERSKWHQYALVMPYERREIVLSKFCLLSICSLTGIALASIIGLALQPVLALFSIQIIFEVEEFLSTMLLGFSLALIYGSFSIPLIFKLGAEKARLLTILSFLIPTAIGFIIFKIALALGIVLTDSLVVYGIMFSPVVALLWMMPLYFLSLSIFNATEDF